MGPGVASAWCTHWRSTCQPRRRAGRGLASFPGRLKLTPGLRARAVAQGKPRGGPRLPLFPMYTRSPLPLLMPPAVSRSALSFPALAASALNNEAPEGG